MQLTVHVLLLGNRWISGLTSRWQEKPKPTSKLRHGVQNETINRPSIIFNTQDLIYMQLSWKPHFSSYYHRLCTTYHVWCIWTCQNLSHNILILALFFLQNTNSTILCHFASKLVRATMKKIIPEITDYQAKASTSFVSKYITRTLVLQLSHIELAEVTY